MEYWMHSINQLEIVNSRSSMCKREHKNLPLIFIKIFYDSRLWIYNASKRIDT